MKLLEAPQARDQPAHGKGWQHIQGQSLGRRRLSQPCSRRRQIIESSGDGALIFASCIGQHQSATATLEKGGAKVGLDLANLPADGAMGHKQLLGGARQIFVARRSFEGAQGRQGG